MRRSLPQKQQERGLDETLDTGMNPPAATVEPPRTGATSVLPHRRLSIGKTHMQENRSKTRLSGENPGVLLNELVEVSAEVASTRARLKKIEALAGVLEREEAIRKIRA